MWLLRVVVNGCLFWVSVSGLNDSRSIAQGGKKQRFFCGRDGNPNSERHLISFRCRVGAVRRFVEPQARRYTNSRHRSFPGSVLIQIFRSATVCEAPVAALRLVCDTAALQTNQDTARSRAPLTTAYPSRRL